MYKVFLTGATGYIGSEITKHLLKDSYFVHIIVRENSNLDLLNNEKKRIKIHKFDDSLENLILILKSIKPDIVIHTASLSLVKHSNENIKDLINSNILFPLYLIEAMIKNKIYNIINTGSFWQNYENKTYNPVNLYASTKEAFEVITKFYIDSTPLKLITLKLFDTYGPDDPRDKIFNQINKATKEKKVLKMSPGHQLINLVYISDIVEAYTIAMKRMLNNKMQLKSETFSICQDSSLSLKEIVKEYLKISKKNISISWGALKYRPRQIMIPWDRGEKLPGWRPKVSMQKGFKLLLKI